jgi:hypothetical protein
LRLQGTCLLLFRESISWIISPFKFWTATIFLHAHLQVVYYKCVKFHKNPISRLGGVALTRYMDGRTGWFLYTPPPQKYFVCGGYNKQNKQRKNQNKTENKKRGIVCMSVNGNEGPHRLQIICCTRFQHVEVLLINMFLPMFSNYKVSH